MKPMKHNPAFLPRDELVRRFVVRRHELDTLVRVIRDNRGAANTHVLVVAPRGLGKTTLLHRMVAEVQTDSDLREQWFPVVFGEESYEVATEGEFWLEALLHLADATGEARWRDAYTELRREPDEKRLATAARARLLDFADERHVRLLLVVENLDMLLGGEQMSDQDAWALRGTLQHEPRIMLVASAVHRFEGVDEPDRPMFELFRRMEMVPLTTAECDLLWASVAGQPLGGARPSAVRILTGGNPRLVMLLASFAEGRGLRQLLDDLAGLIDDNTDYFKQNIEALTGQSRKTFLALAELWEPSSARAVAEAARLDVNLVSSMLGRLVQQGRVTIARTRGRQHWYQVSERLYNIYYLMRRRGGVEARVRALVDFISHFYDPAEVPDVMRGIAGEACGQVPDRRTEHLRIYEHFFKKSRPEEFDRLMLETPLEFLTLEDLPKDVKRTLKSPKALIALLKRPDGEKWTDEAVDALNKKRRGPDVSPAVLELARLVASRPPLSDRALLACLTSLAAAREFAGAAAILEQRVAGSPEDFQLWRLIGMLSGLAGLRDRAIAAWRRALELRPGTLQAVSSLGVLLVEDHDTRHEGIELLRRAVAGPPATPQAWLALSRVLVAAGSSAEGKSALDSGIAAFPTDSPLHDQRFRWAYDAGQPAEAIEAARVWTRQCPQEARAATWLTTAEWRGGNLVAMEEAARAAISRFPEHAPAWFWLAAALYDQQRFAEALSACRRAFQLDPADPIAWQMGLRLAAILDLPAIEPSLDRALAAVGDAPGARTEFARILLDHGPEFLLPRAVSLALDALRLDPQAETRSILAALLGRSSRSRDAFDALASALRDPELVRDSLQAAQTDCIRLAASGLDAETLALLRDTPSGALLEPIVVALRLRLGETVDAPLEVHEVALDVNARIDALAASGDIWRTDPLTLPLADHDVE